jgi:hypothetical protein
MYSMINGTCIYDITSMSLRYRHSVNVIPPAELTGIFLCIRLIIKGVILMNPIDNILY